MTGVDDVTYHPLEENQGTELQRILVEEVVVHSDWTSDSNASYDADIAMIITSTVIRLSMTVAPIRLSRDRCR